MKRLARSLKIQIPHAVGILEMLWQYAAEFYPAGDVGRAHDEDISEAIGWHKDPSEVVRCLTASGWLDPADGEQRLLIHDWPVHAEDAVHLKMARQLRFFADGSAPRYGRLSGAERARADAFYTATAAHPVRTGSALHDSSGPQVGQGMASNTKTPIVEILSNTEKPPNARVRSDEPMPWYRNFLELWMAPCACCGMMFPATQVDLGAQVWLQLEGSGKINADTVRDVMDGLRLHRASKTWHDGYVVAVPGFLGWSKEGRPGAPRWNDKPAPFVPEIERPLPKTVGQLRHDKATAEFLGRPR